MTKSNKNPKNKALSHRALNLVTGFVQIGFHRSDEKQITEIDNSIQNEIITSSNMHCDIKLGTSIFSHCLTTFHNDELMTDTNQQAKTAKKHSYSNNGEDGITIEYGQYSHFLKFLKLRERHTLKAIDEGMEKFVKNLDESNEMTIQKYVNRQENGQKVKIKTTSETFSIFSKLSVNTQARTLTFKFSAEFINYLNSKKSPFTHIQIEDIKKLKSNRTSASLFMMVRSIAGMTKQKFFTRKYLANCLGFTGNNSNQKLDSAFENLTNRKALKVEKKIKKSSIFGYWAMYVFTEIVSAYDKIKAEKSSKKEKKEQKINPEVNSNIFNSKVSGDERSAMMNTHYLSLV